MSGAKIKRRSPRPQASESESERLLAVGETPSSSPTRRGAQTICSYFLCWDDLAPWQRNNHFIHTGYRPVTNSFSACIRSLFYIQNESVNIHSHLLGALLTVPLAHWFFTVTAARYPTAGTADTVVFACFFLAAITCFAMSATYHTISNHSARIARRAIALDFLGIVGLVTGSFIPSIYYGFYCRPRLQYVYWSMICSLGFACALATLVEPFRSQHKTRTALFVSVGLSGLLPITHGLLERDVSQLRREAGLDWILLQAALYLLGAYIYAARIPEKWFPGRFDIVGSSHQIFHVLVVVAALAHFKGLIVAFDHWHGLDNGHETCS